jgi:polysaccharide pyruvyl transferase WcaK-like protein
LLAAGLVERGFDVRYIVGHVSPDLEAIADAMRQHESSPVEAAHVAVAPIASVSELLAALRSCDAVVSSRYHGVVLSELLALPVMAVSYERKIDDQMRDFGLERYVLPIGEFSAAQALPMFDRLWGERDGIRLRLAVLAADRTRRVAEQFDLLASRHLPPPAVPATACSEGT